MASRLKDPSDTKPGQKHGLRRYGYLMNIDRLGTRSRRKPDPKFSLAVLCPKDMLSCLRVCRGAPSIAASHPIQTRTEIHENLQPIVIFKLIKSTDFSMADGTGQSIHSSRMSSLRRRDKLGLLICREIGGFSSWTTGNRSFEKQMLKSQSFGNKQQLRPSYYQKDILGHFGCVNAVEFSHGPEEFLASGKNSGGLRQGSYGTCCSRNTGMTYYLFLGGDDKRVLVWKASELFTKLDKPKLEVMKGRHESNIFCLAFTSDTEQLLSSGT